MPSIKKNIAYQSIYQLLTTLLPLVLTPYISRVLGAEKIGIYAYSLSISTYFIYFAKLGIEHHGSRTIAAVRDNRDKLNKTFSDLFFLHLTVSLIILLAYTSFVIFFVVEYKLYFAFLGITILAALFDITWLFSGLEQFKTIVTRNTIIKILTVACVFIFIKNKNDLWKYILIMSIGTFAGQIIVWFFLKKHTSIVKPTWNGIKPHIKPILILFIPVIATSVYNIMDKIMLGAMTDKVQLGFYENSEKIIFIPMGFIIAFNGVMIPRMSNLGAKKDKSAQNRLTLISMKYVMILAFAMMFGIAGIANGFAPLFFGEEFRNCGVLITCLCAVIPFLAFSNLIAAQYLVPNSKDKLYTISTVAGAVINIIANLILIPRFQAMGAAVGTILAESLRCIVMVIATRKALPVLTYIKNSLFFLFAGVIMFTLVRYVGFILNESIVTVLFQVVLGAALYLLLSVVFLYLKKDEFLIKNLKRILRR